MKVRVNTLPSRRYEGTTVRTQVFGFRVCASRLAASLVLPAHAVPSIRKIYHRKWDITLLTALGSGFLVLVKETLHGPSPWHGDGRLAK